MVPLPEDAGVAASPELTSVGDGSLVAPVDALQPVEVRVSTGVGHQVAFRGEGSPFAVSGRVVDPGGGAGVAGVQVQVHLIPLERGPPVPLSPAGTTDADGAFSIAIQIPGTLTLGDYRVVVASAAKGPFAAARSDSGGQSPSP